MQHHSSSDSSTDVNNVECHELGWIHTDQSISSDQTTSLKSFRLFRVIRIILSQIISSFIMTARSSTASLDAMSDFFFINSTNQNSADSDSLRSDSEIFLDVETFFCNDIDLDKANHHILNRYVTYRVSQYAVLGIENYDLWICIQTDFVLFIENHLS